MENNLRYLTGYPTEIIEAVQQRLQLDRLSEYLIQRYPKAHHVRTDNQLLEYTQDLKKRFLKRENPLSKVLYDAKIRDVRGALGTHTSSARAQGQKTKVKNEIRVASTFRYAPEEFLRMIVVHELAHLRHREHDKAFYDLCTYMEPDYHQFELDVRIYLTHCASGGQNLYGNSSKAHSN